MDCNHRYEPAGDGGDMLRMAANALREEDSGFRVSKRVFLSDFPLSDRAKYRQSVRGLSLGSVGCDALVII